MIILGIDPGYATTGYGVIEKNALGQIRVLDFGAIITSKDESFPVRLAMIKRGIESLLLKFKPDAVSVEELFFNQNITTGIAVAEARGVILCTAIDYVPQIYEFTPKQIKLSITGYGKADKKQVQLMTQAALHLKQIPKPDDAADALAVALCLAQTNTKLISSEVTVFTNNKLSENSYEKVLKERSQNDLLTKGKNRKN